MTKSLTQLRGHCQCCGRLQAVDKGTVAKHGYKVESRGQSGWFSGVCGGHQFSPMQVERKVTDTLVAQVRAEVTGLRARADSYESGVDHPETVRTQKYDSAARDYVRVAWDKAEPFQRQDEVRAQVAYLRNRANSGESWADGMEKLANEFHGTALVEVVKPEAPAPILCGERRQAVRGILTAKSMDRGMVWWEDERGFKSRMSTRSWRALPLA